MAFRSRSSSRPKSRHHLAKSKSRVPFIGSSYARRLRVESLEDRRLLAVFSVSNLNDAGAGSLRDAITQANSTVGADTIAFASGAGEAFENDALIRLTSGELAITESLTIDGLTAGGTVVITGDAGDDDITLAGNITDVAASLANSASSLDDNSRVLNFTASSGDLTLNNLAITGGRADSSSLNGDDGGGIRFGGSGLSGTLTLDQSTVSGNSTTGSNADGGGIFTSSGSVSLTSSTVSGNESGDAGGGIFTVSGGVSLTNSTVSENESGDAGGGIFTVSGGVSLTNSTVSENESGDDGGGIFTVSGGVSLTSSTISENESGLNGGGISTSSGSVSLTNSTISGNESGLNGGGIRAFSGAVNLTSSTVSENEAAASGGGVFVSNTVNNPNFMITNSIIAGNLENLTAPGVGAPNDLVPDPDSPLTVNHSLIGVRNSGLTPTQQIAIFTVNSNQSGFVNNPRNPLLGPLADNGGPTFTHALLAGSPAIDAGSSSETFDQRGAPFSRDDGNGVDIGAYEVQSLNLMVDTTSDLIDGDYSANNLSLREAITLTNANPNPDMITFDAAVFDGAGNNSLIRLGGTELEITDTLTIDASSATGVTITGDAADDDITLAGNITDVAASLANSANSLDDNSRVLNFTATTGDLTLNNLTITGGRADSSSLTSDDGGGIRFGGSGLSGTLTLDQSAVSGNSATGHFAHGGGIFTISGSVSLTSSTVSGNSATGNSADGGGIFAFTGTVSLTSSTVSGNSATGNTSYGGGIFSNSGAVSLTSSTVSGNESGSLGGGIFSSSGAVSLTNSTVSGNESGSLGGGIYTRSGAVSLTSSTVSGNEAVGAGGGVFVGNTSINPNLMITNSIIAGNTDNGNAPDLRPDVESTLTINHSLIGVADNLGTITGNTGNLTGTGSNPLDPLLGPLADNGGPTQTHALVFGSPAMNAGDPAITSGFDQRGTGFGRLELGQVDIGAYELQASDLSAIDLIVSTTDDENDGDLSTFDLSLREAILIANIVPDSDTITFDATVFDGGTNSLIRLNGTELEITDTLTIDASSATGVTITGDASDNDVTDGANITDVAASLTNDPTSLDDNSRVLNFTATTGDLTLNNLTITGGRTDSSSPNGDDGGGIRFGSNGTLTLDQSTVGGNSTIGTNIAHGGGIYTNTGDVRLTSSRVSGNESDGHGGGIFTSSGLVTLSSSTVSGNSTTSNYTNGGGIFTSSGLVTLSSSTVSGNSTTGISARGGGISTSSGAVTLSSSTVSGNSTTGNFARGGGIFTLSGLVTLTSSTVSGNSTTGSLAYGGGISTSSGAVTLSSSTVSGNSTAGNNAYGGGIFTFSGEVTLTSSTVSGNEAAGAGGGVFVRDLNANPSFTIHNSIVAGNLQNVTAPGFGTPNDLVPGPGSTLTINHSLIGVADNLGTITGNTGNLTGTGASPLDPLLGPLADNGGPTQTHALLPGSPAINAGDDLLTEPVDQRGFTRDVNGVDIGAFEAQEAPSLVVNTTSDTIDEFDQVTSLREAIGFANLLPDSDTITFGALFASEQTIDLGSQLPTIIDAVTIAGPGADLLTIDAGNGADGTFHTGDGNRIFKLDDGDMGTEINVTLSGMKLTGGDVSGGDPSGFGGAIFNVENLTLTGSTISGNAAEEGGGIYNFGTITSISESTISGNTADSLGGGVYNDGTITSISRSTISGNSASYGGGIYNYGTIASLSHSTLSGNMASDRGGGIYNDGTITSISQSTLSGNSAFQGGGIYNYGNAGTITTLTGTIIANSVSGGDILGTGTIANSSYNLVEDGGGGLAGMGDITGDPQLGPLSDNGGATQTHALLPGSAAINAGDPVFALPPDFDQRGNGFDRVSLGRIDIGAFEWSPMFDVTGDVLIQLQQADPSLLEVSVDGSILATEPLAQIGSLEFASPAGQATSLTVDYSNGFFHTASDISFAGNNGDDDQLNVVGDASPRRTRAMLLTSGVLGTGSLQTVHGIESNAISFTDLTTLDFGSLLTFEVEGVLSVGFGETLKVDATGFTQLDTTTILDGGTIEAPSGVSLTAGLLTGHGTVTGPFVGGNASVIEAVGGELILGDATSVIGFFSDGVLHTGANTVTINDANQAVLGSLTTLGYGTNGGALVAGTPSPVTPERGGFLLEAGKNLSGKGTIRGDFHNLGSVVGNAIAVDMSEMLTGEGIVFDIAAGGGNVSGIGYFENTAIISVFDPGSSPGIATGSRFALGGLVTIELGGTLPGTGAGFHDQILDTQVTTLFNSVDLEIKSWNGFQPEVGDEFEVMRWEGELNGAFDQVSVDPAFAASGIDFELQYSANSLTLLAVEAAALGDFNADGDVDGSDFLSWQRGFGSSYSVDDLDDWQNSYGEEVSSVAAAISPANSEAATSITEAGETPPKLTQPAFDDPAPREIINAARAWQLTTNAQEPAETILQAVAPIDEIFDNLATDDFAWRGNAMTSARDVAAELDNSAVDEDATSTTGNQWLADEMLERVFG